MDHEAVFWDVGGVILDIDSIGRAQHTFVEIAVAEYDLGYTPEEALSVWRDALREHFAGRDGLAYRTARDGRRKAVEDLFDGDPPADWEHTYERASEDAVELNPGVEKTMRRLDEAGVYQAVVSDADEGLADRLGNVDVHQYLSDVTTSEEVGYVKPDQRMFETAFEKARDRGVDPTTGVMVGDKYENDMEGGTEAGLATAAFGAEDGPAVDYHLDEIPNLLDVVGISGRD